MANPLALISALTTADRPAPNDTANDQSKTDTALCDGTKSSVTPPYVPQPKRSPEQQEPSLSSDFVPNHSEPREGLDGGKGCHVACDACLVVGYHIDVVQPSFEFGEPMGLADTQVFTRGLPVPRGPLSATVVTALAQSPSSEQLPLADVDHADPYGEDLTLALYTCYELHYRGFDGVDPLWEWEPELLRLRAMMERAFLTALRSDTDGGDDVTAALDALLREPVPGNGVSHYLRDAAQWWHMREYIVHRSVYHLKEADPVGAGYSATPLTWGDASPVGSA
jgi:hypothetical protein